MVTVVMRDMLLIAMQFQPLAVDLVLLQTGCYV